MFNQWIIMLREQVYTLRKITITLDMAIVVGSFLIAYYLRRSEGAVGYMHLYAWLLLFALPSWFLLLQHFGLYESQRISTYTSVVLAIFKVHIFGAIILSSIVFFLDPHAFSRLLFGYFLLLSFSLTVLYRISAKLFLGSIRKNGYNFKNILVVGSGNCAFEISELISGQNSWGLKVIKTIVVTGDAQAVDDRGIQIIRSLEEIIIFCKENIVDEVVFALEKEPPFSMELMLQELQGLGLTSRVIINSQAPYSIKPEVGLFHNFIPIITYRCNELTSDQRVFKRCIDIVGSLVGLTITALMLPFIVLSIKLDSPGPIFFGQPRVRENGRSFTCWKFRTMNVNAEAEKQQLMAQNEMNGAMFKLKNDPRVTAVGAFLRKLSIDEFPQFWNVLLGDMSLVGTRPPTPNEVATYENWHRRRISIKPGITGLWQISGRNKIKNFDDVVRLDIKYIESWTVWLDIKIIFITPWVMFSREGAS